MHVRRLLSGMACVIVFGLGVSWMTIPSIVSALAFDDIQSLLRQIAELEKRISEINTQSSVVANENNSSISSTIYNFAECVAAGNPVAESNPRQCKTRDGQLFYENVSSQIPATSGVSPSHPGIDNRQDCTFDYAPVCGRPQGCVPCPPGQACTDMCRYYPSQTYPNKCALDMANAELIHEGVCAPDITYKAPAASPVAGTYTATQRVKLSQPGASLILYTLNATIPKCTPGTGTVYVAPIIIAQNTTIKAIACYPTGSSAVVSYTYRINLKDTTPPIVSIKAPVSRATVSGIINIAATATDNVRVAGVTFKRGLNTVSGVAIGVEDTVAPYGVTLNTKALPNGPLTLYAVARDTANNRATSVMVTVNVSNPKHGTRQDCTFDYAPVCGRPQGCVPCPPGQACTDMCRYYPSQTYPNKCALDMANAELIHEGVCTYN